MKKYPEKDYSNKMHDNTSYRALRPGSYYTDNSDLIIKIKTIGYQNEEYAKVKCILVNKNNGIIYSDRYRYYKVYKKNITHWKRL